MVYFELAGTTFKERFNNHICTFGDEQKMYKTRLSKYYWDIVKRNQTPIIRWKIVKKAKTAKDLDTNCNLCTWEKISIIRFKDRRKLLNKRNEIAAACRHKSRLPLKYHDIENQT